MIKMQRPLLAQLRLPLLFLHHEENPTVLQQRKHSGFLIGFQNIHSMAFLRGRPESMSRL